MDLALEQAQFAGNKGEVPIGAVLVGYFSTDTIIDGYRPHTDTNQSDSSNSTYHILAKAHNLVETNMDASAHAELLALRKGAQNIRNWRYPPNTTLYSTLEPCPVCFSSAQSFRIDNIVYGAKDVRLGALGSHLDLIHVKHPYHEVKSVVGGVRGEECGGVIREFFRERRKKKQKQQSDVEDASIDETVIEPNRAAGNSDSSDESRWRRRTAKRRQRADDLLDAIEVGGLPRLTPHAVLDVSTLQIPSRIDWDTVDPSLDPMHGGKLRDSERGVRKRAQVDGFYYVLSSLVEAMLQFGEPERVNRVTIVDAGCGAGNLAIPLAGLFASKCKNVSVLAVDVNKHALQRLDERARQMNNIKTCCADLADYEYISSQIPQGQNVIVVSLHACGAASDMAMNLAFRCNSAPFVICPCCTAKSLMKRSSTNNKPDSKSFSPAASFQRSGASTDITYPRSGWLKSRLLESGMSTAIEEQYTLLAKVADVGLGPQTPSQQRQTQYRAKKVVELDRLLSASENKGYDVRLMRLPDHDPLVYSKGDLLLGAKGGSLGANVIRNLS